MFARLFHCKIVGFSFSLFLAFSLIRRALSSYIKKYVEPLRINTS